MGKRPPIDEKAAGAYIGMSVAFMRKARSSGTVGNRTPAPPHLKIGGAVRYDPDDLDAWLAARRRLRTSEQRSEPREGENARRWARTVRRSAASRLLVHENLRD